MKVAFSTGRPAHVALPANLLATRGTHVTIYTAAYRSRFRGLTPSIRLQFVPQFVSTVHFLTGVHLPRSMQRADTTSYDHMVALRMKEFDLFWGLASGALASARAARRKGARFVLDRACPHVDVQQALVRMESERLGVAYFPEPSWFRDRQMAEYAEADIILVPSNYSRQSFPQDMQGKVIVAPLFGRVPAPAPRTAAIASLQGSTEVRRPFTFGIVGGQPRRKGFLYLLQAWERLQLPQSRLLLRTDAALHRYPALHALLQRLHNVQIVRYCENMSDFYRQCDAFVFPTVDDGFGMVLLEAMAHGLPVITTTHCGAAELFTPDRDLLMVPPQNSDALAEAMHRLHTSIEERERLRNNGLGALQRIEGQGEYALYSQALDHIVDSLKLAKV
jgi:glycosyltransferase involved in cell wall biosynthesis